MEEGKALVSRDGGPAFWKFFEDKVIDHLTKEHEQIQVYKRCISYRDDCIQKQRDLLYKALDNNNMDEIIPCESCGIFFVYNVENDAHYGCDCGNVICGTNEDCQPCMCIKCENLGCSICIDICNKCEECYCAECIRTCNRCDVCFCAECIGICYRCDGCFCTKCMSDVTSCLMCAAVPVEV